MLAQPLQRPSHLYDHQHQHPSHIARSSRKSIQSWVSSYSTPITPTQSDFSFTTNYTQSPDADQSSLFDYNTQQSFNNLRIHVDSPYVASQEPELMHSEQTVAPASWNFMNGQLTPTSARTHYRESSLSSIGSTGPASPYNSSTPHPHVLPSDGETNYDGLPLIETASYHTFSKPLTPSHTPSHDNFLAPPFQQSYNIPSYSPNSHIAALMAMQRQQASGDDESMPASDYGHSGRPSVASTHESPATPPVAAEYEDRGRKIDFRSVPKLDRTMSDIYNDELYSPNFTFTSAPSTKVETMPMPHPPSAVFSQMLQVANNQHLSAPPRSPLGDQGRDQKAAFREGSPLAPASNNFNSTQMRFGSAQQMRERQKAESDDRILQQQMQRTSPVQTAPKTISPRDALLDYHGTEEESAMPLFPPQQSPQYHLQTNLAHGHGQTDMDDTASQQSFGSMATSRRESSSTYSTSSHTPQQPGTGFAFAPLSVPGGIRVPQQYPFVPQQRRQPSNLADRSQEFPSTLSSMESSGSEYKPDSSDTKKPTGSNADSGTYTCTYHGCTLRFETPAKLQKHKREGHRQSAPLVGGSSAATTTQQSQAGPHVCKRINPSSGKPCNVVFSRPYDLTRHEHSIHNPRKVKVQCPFCKEEKTFSRADALTRHLKIIHPSYNLPTKSRRGQQ